MTIPEKPGKIEKLPGQMHPQLRRCDASFSSRITVLTIASRSNIEEKVVELCNALRARGLLKMRQDGFYTRILAEIAPEQRILVVGGHLSVCVEGQLCSYLDFAEEQAVRIEVLLPLDLIHNQAHDTLATKLAYLKSRDNSFVAHLRETSVSWLLMMDGKVVDGRLKPGQIRIDFCARFFSDTNKLKKYLGII